MGLRVVLLGKSGFRVQPVLAMSNRDRSNISMSINMMRQEAIMTAGTMEDKMEARMDLVGCRSSK